MRFKRILSVVLAAGLILAAAPTTELTAVAVNTTNNTTGNLKNATALNSGKQTTGTLTDSKKEISYKFTAPGSGFLSFYIERADVTSTNQPTWKVEVFDSEAKPISSATETNFYTQTVMVQKDSLYYVRVSAGQNAYNEKYGITAQFTEYEDVIAGAGQSAEDPVRITLGKKYVGTLDSASDADFIKLSSDTSGYVKMSLKKYISSIGTTADWRFELYDSEMNNLYILQSSYQTDSLNTENLYLAIPAGKSYIIKISGSQSTAGLLYALDTHFTATSLVETEPNNSFANPDKIKLKKTYCAALAETATKDYYVYKASKSAKHTLTITLSNELEKGYTVGIYDADRNVIVTKENVVKKGKVSFSAKKGKKYYVVVEHAASGTPSVNALYKIKLSSK